MNLFKKATATLALVALLSGIFSTGVSAASTAEIEAANYLAKAGIIVDHTDNPTAYNLDQNVLRQEIAAVARGIAKLDKKTTCDGVFKDVSATKPNNWACYTVEQLADNGLIALNENFRPEDNISKAEGIGMIVKAAFDDEYEYDPTLNSTWQEQVVAFAVKNGVTNNFTNYDTPATRGFVFAAWANAMIAVDGEGETDIDKIMCELLGICEDEGEKGGEEDPTKPVVTTGNVEITLNPKSPAAQTIPSSGLVPFGKFDLSAGKEDVKIDSITLKREGLSQRTDIRRVYFEKNGIRISNRASVSIDEQAIVTFTPALTIKAGSTETVDLIVELREPTTGNDTGATVGAEHRFSILASSDIEASSTVGGTFPLRTALMRVGSYIVEKVQVKPIGGTDNDLSDTTHNVGTENALMTEFQLVTNGDRNNIFKSVTFRNGWDADASSSLANIGIYKDGKKISTEVSILGRDVTVYVNDLILNGRSENYQLRADVTGAERTNETYQFEIRNASDLTVVEEESGFSAPVDLSETTFTSNRSKWMIVKVEWGDFLVSRDTAYTLNQTVSASTNDVVLYAAKINVKEEVSVEDVLVNLAAGLGHASGSLMDFSSLRFVVGDATVATYTPVQADANLNKFVFEGNFNIRAGQSTMKITWNLRTNVVDGAMFRVDDVQLGGASKEIRYVSNDEKVTVNGKATGITTTVADGALTFTKNDGIDNNTIVPGTTDKLIFGFAARANDVSDVRITWMKFNANLTAGVTESQITNVRLYQDGKLVPNGTKNNFDFNSIDVTIKKNTTANFEVVADFSNAISTGATFQLTLPATGVNARNTDSNQTVTPNAVDGVAFKFSEGGSLRVVANSSQVQSSIITPSTSETSVFKFDLEADDDSVMVTDIFVTNLHNSTGASLNDMVRSSSLFINGRSYPGSVVGTGALHFAIGTNGVIVKRDEIMTWDVRVALHDSQTRSGADFQLAIKFGDTGSVNGTQNGIRALSESTGKEITTSLAGNADVKSNQHLVARSKPTVAMSNFTASTSDVYRFTITADANRKITLDEINLEIAGQASFTGGTLKIYRDNQSNGNEVFTKVFTAGGAASVDNQELVSALSSTGAGTSTGTKYTYTFTVGGAASFDAGDKFVATVAGTDFSVVAAASDTQTAVAGKLETALTATYGASAVSSSTNVVTLVLDDQLAEPVVSATASDAGVNKWAAGQASKEIAAGQTVTFYAIVENGVGYPDEKSRETRVVDVVYKDDLNTTAPVNPIHAANYNTGLPTTTSSYKY